MKPAETKEEIQRFYSTLESSDKYIEERFKSPIGLVMHRRQAAFINRIIETYKVNKILEMAPGPARIAVDIKGFRRGIMVDYNENMIKIAKKRLEIKGLSNYWQFIIADAFALHLKQKFDLVCSFRFVRHFKLEMRKKIYGVIRESLSSSGYFIFDAPNINVVSLIRQKEGPGKIYDELYTKENLIKELNDNGFNVLETVGVWAHYLKIQYWIQVFLGPRWYWGAYFLINLLECDKAKNPLEWIILCQKK